MARYLYADVRTFLVAQGCYTEGDAYEIGVGWFTADGLPFTIPSPIDDHLDADVLELILRDRWVFPGPVPLTRHSDE